MAQLDDVPRYAKARAVFTARMRAALQRTNAVVSENSFRKQGGHHDKSLKGTWTYRIKQGYSSMLWRAPYPYLCHTEERFFSYVEGDVDLIAQTLCQTAKEGTTTGEINTVLHDVGIEFRWSVRERIEHCRFDKSHRTFETVGDFLIAHGHFHRKRSDTVRSMHPRSLRELRKVAIQPRHYPR